MAARFRLLHFEIFLRGYIFVTSISSGFRSIFSANFVNSGLTQLINYPICTVPRFPAEEIIYVAARADEKSRTGRHAG